MANSAIVGTLKILLTANTAEFETAMKGVGKDLDALGGKATSFGALVKGLGPMLAGAFTIGAVAKLTGDFVEMSGALVDLEAKTGLSVGALQRLKLATQESGVGLDTVAAASLALSKRLGEGKDSTLGALTAVGLKYEEIRALSPEDQFFTIADALGKIGDQNDKVALTNELLGKQGNELLPALNGHLRETAEAYRKMGLEMDENVIRKAADLGDQWDVLKSLGGALIAQVLGPMIPVLASLTKALIEAAPAIAAVAKWLLELIGAPFDRLLHPLRDLIEVFDLLTLKAAKLPEIKVPTLKVPTPEGPKPLTPDDFKAIDAELTASAQQRIKDNQAAIKGVDDRTAALRTFYNWVGEREIEAVAREQAQADQQAAIWREYYNFLGERRMEDEAAAEAARRPLAATMGEPKGGWQLHPPVTEVRAAGQSLGALMLGGLGDVFKNQLGPTVMAAITGGGSITGSIGGLIGQSLGGSLAKGLGSTLSNVLGKTLGGALGSMLPGVGALLGPLIGKGLEKIVGLFGVSKEVKQSRTELEGFQKTLRATLTDTQKAEAGSEAWKQDVVAVRDAYLATGRSADAALAIVKQLWDTDHPERSKAAIEEINRVLKEQGEITQANEQAAADAAAAREQELSDLQGQLHDLQQEAVVDWEDMAAAAKRYGVDVDSLGDAFQGQRIHASAQTIIDDFNLLTRNGAQVGGVLFGMREEITALVRDAMRFGTALPENFRPLVAELQRSGNLVDENGDALTDISRLQFGDPIVAKLDAVNEAIADVTRRIEELAAAITGPLVDAFDRIRFTEPRIPGAPVNVPMLAGGGIVTGPTLAMIGEGSQPEAVIPLDRLRDTGHGGGIVVLPFIPITDPYAAAEEAARQFGRRVGGDSHGMREVLEQVIDDWMRTYSPVRA